METYPYVVTANRACSLLYSYIREHANGIWLLPVNVCPDVPLTFCLANVPFEFVDIGPDTLCLDINKVEQILHQSPSCYVGVLFVRTYGVLNDTSSEFNRIKAIKEDILIVDDRCLCVPERYPKFWNADMILYSTGHCKQIDLGGGGMAFYKVETQFRIDSTLIFDGTDEEELYKKSYLTGNPLDKIPQGWLNMDKYLPSDEYLSRIEKAVPKRLEYRDMINNIYVNNLPPSIQMRQEYQTWRFNIRVKPSSKKTILDRLFKSGLFASNHYHSANRLFDFKKFPTSDALHESVINLFNDMHYSVTQAIRTCDIINATL